MIGQHVQPVFMCKGKITRETRERVAVKTYFRPMQFRGPTLNDCMASLEEMISDRVCMVEVDNIWS